MPVAGKPLVGQAISLPALSASQSWKQQETDALVVAAAFNGFTRVADATGVPLDPHTAEKTVEMRKQADIHRFRYTEKSTRYDL